MRVKVFAYMIKDHDFIGNEVSQKIEEPINKWLENQKTPIKIATVLQTQGTLSGSPAMYTTIFYSTDTTKL